MITIASRYLPCHNQEAADFLERFVDPADVVELDPCFFNHSLHHLPVLYRDLPPIKVGTLSWPIGASRFAIGHYLCDDSDLAAIKSSAWTNSGPQPVTLTIDDRTLTTDPTTNRQVSTSVYLLPPRPLSTITGNNGLYLLTAIDARFYWWFVSAEISNGSSWTNLFSNIATALGVSITVGTIDAGFSVPSNRFTSHQQPIPLLLDAAAASCGMKVIRRLDGSVRVEDYTTASTVNATEATKVDPKTGPYYPLAGGVFDNTTIIQSVPSDVQVVFGRTDDLVYNRQPYTIDVSLTSLALSQFPSITGFTGKKVLTGDLTATYVAESLTNSDTLNSYANAMAKAYYLWQISAQDQVCSGIAPWIPNGQIASIVWTYRQGNCSTRVQRDRWVDRDLGRQRVNANEGLYSTYPDVDNCLWLKTLDSYDGTQIQLFGHDASGNCILYDVGTCDTAFDAITIGSTPTVAGTPGSLLYDNSGLVGEVSPAVMLAAALPSALVSLGGITGSAGEIL